MSEVHVDADGEPPSGGLEGEPADGAAGIKTEPFAEGGCHLLPVTRVQGAVVGIQVLLNMALSAVEAMKETGNSIHNGKLRRAMGALEPSTEDVVAFG
jgi:hypothetical protein